MVDGWGSQCPRCGSTAPLDDGVTGCGSCGDEGVGMPMVPRREPLTDPALPGPPPVGLGAMWRWSAHLPPVGRPVSLGEGGTPLVDVELSDVPGRLLLKDERANPTGSFKDRLVAETAQDAVFTIDEKSRVLNCNPAVERIFGYKPSDLIGRNLDMIIPERLREAHHRGIERYLQTGKRNIPWDRIELPALHREGHEFPAEMSFGQWSRDGGTLFTGYVRDITERKRAAEELRQSLDEARTARDQLQRRAEEEARFRRLASALTGATDTTEVLYEITNSATQVTRADGVYVERIVSDDGVVEVVATAGQGTPPRGLRVAYPGSMTEEIMNELQPIILADMKRFGRSMAPYLADSCENCQFLVTPLVAENSVLGALYRNGACSIGELAAHERVQPPSMTRTVNCLEEAGYVVRRPHETDGRQVVIELAEKGTATLEADRRRRDAWLAQRLRELSPEERSVLRQAAPILERLAHA